MRLPAAFVEGGQWRGAAYSVFRQRIIAGVFNGAGPMRARNNMRQNRKRCGIAVFVGAGAASAKPSPKLAQSRLVAKYCHIAYRRAQAIKPLPNAQSLEHGLGGRAQGQDALPIFAAA